MNELKTEHLLLMAPFYKEFCEQFNGSEDWFIYRLKQQYRLSEDIIVSIMNKIVEVLGGDQVYVEISRKQFQHQAYLYPLAQKVIERYVEKHLPNPIIGNLSNDRHSLTVLQCRYFGDIDKVETTEDRAYWKAMLASLQTSVTSEEIIKRNFIDEVFDQKERSILRKVFPYLFGSDSLGDIVEDLEIRYDIVCKLLTRFFHHAWKATQKSQQKELIEYGKRFENLNNRMIRKILPEQRDFWDLLISQLKYRSYHE